MQFPADDGVVEINGEVPNQLTALVQYAPQQHDLTVGEPLIHVPGIEEFTFPLPVKAENDQTIISYRHMSPIDNCLVRPRFTERSDLIFTVETLPDMVDYSKP